MPGVNSSSLMTHGLVWNRTLNAVVGQTAMLGDRMAHPSNFGRSELVILTVNL